MSRIIKTTKKRNGYPHREHRTKKGRLKYREYDTIKKHKRNKQKLKEKDYEEI